MPKTLAEKLWDSHVVRSAPGEPDLLFIDMHLIHEVTSPQAFEGLRLNNRAVHRPDLTLARRIVEVVVRNGSGLPHFVDPDIAIDNVLVCQVKNEERFNEHDGCHRVNRRAHNAALVVVRRIHFCSDNVGVSNCCFHRFTF